MSSQPSAVRRAGSLSGKMTAGARKEPSAPKISSCAAAREPGADLQRVVGHEAHAPAGGHVAAGHLDPDLRVRRDVGLDAAVAARHEQAVEAGVVDRLVEVLGRAAQRLGLRGALGEQRAQRAGALQQLVGGHLGGGDRHASSVLDVDLEPGALLEGGAEHQHGGRGVLHGHADGFVEGQLVG